MVLLTLSFLGNHSCEIWVDDLLGPFYFYYVPDDFTTIQEAIDFAETGDTVVIEAGVYSPSENGEYFPLELKSGVSLKGSNNTILDAENSGPIFDLFNLSGITIEDLTLRNGWANQGGALSIVDSSVTLKNLLIHHNRADLRGSAIYLEDADGTVIKNNLIYNNYQTVSGGGNPAQVEAIASNFSFINNTVANGDGDGLKLMGSSTTTVLNNIFYNNGNTTVGVGANDLSSAQNSTITYNLFYLNDLGPLYLQGASRTANDANNFSSADSVYENFEGNPFFVNSSAGDFRLISGSVAIDAGDPATHFNDTNGSRNDLGAYGGPDTL
ncbi:MAG: right-handed parallel beta-helix repeat-containing protein [Deltaproteobacteria bacterium]|nr:right-handed parallel beta-helix repeat-containing protein [Deltaproteobacteria bacterium]